MRLVPFDLSAAQQAGGPHDNSKKKGQPGDLRDTMIAGTDLAHHATLATRNTAHLEDVSITIVNPWAL